MKKNTDTNIVVLYREYRDFTLWGALSADFDFDADFKAYSALVKGDAASLKAATKTRKAAVGKPNFNKAKTDKRRAEARILLDKARAAQYA